MRGGVRQPSGIELREGDVALERAAPEARRSGPPADSASSIPIRAAVSRMIAARPGPASAELLNGRGRSLR